MGNITMGYNIVNIETGDREDFLRQAGDDPEERIGRFSISRKGLEEGNRILSSMAGIDNYLVIIDEVGLLEINGKGWSGSIGKLLENSSANILMTVRDIYVDEVIKKWDLKEAVVFDIAETDYLVAGRAIIEKILPDVSQENKNCHRVTQRNTQSAQRKTK